MLPGPQFLVLEDEQWPTERSAPNMKEVKKERRKITITYATSGLQPIVECTKFSLWKRLLRVTACVIRLCHSVRVDSKNSPSNGGSLN